MEDFINMIKKYWWVLVLIFAIGGYFIVANSSDDVEDDDGDDVSQHQEEHNEMFEAGFMKAFGESFDYEGATDLLDEFEPEVAGDVSDLGMTLLATFCNGFELDEAAVVAFAAHTGLDLVADGYLLCLIAFEDLPDTADLTYELGLGTTSLASSSALNGAVADPDTIEPIASGHYSHAWFFFDDPAWQMVEVLDIANGYTPTGHMSFGYYSMESAVAAVLTPMPVFGVPGDTVDLVIQSFARKTAEGELATAEDPTGVTYQEIDGFELPDPLAVPIFADGFESGDTSAWSN